EAVDRGERRAGDHVRRARPDRGRAGQRAEPVLHPRVAGRGVHHRLLVPGLVVGEELRALVERLADPGDVAVAEDAEAAAEEPVLDPVALDELVREETDEGLRSRQADAHRPNSTARPAVSSAR